MSLLRFLVFILLSLLPCAQISAEEKPGPPITAASFGDRETNPDQTNGDTWDSTWLADGRVLIQYNDGNGFSEPHQNVHHDGICELQGSPENLAALRGVDLNPGKLGHFLGETYSTGLYALDGALYHFTCRSIQIPGAWQFYDNCLFKSVDGGATWINHLGEKDRYIPADLSASTFPDKHWSEVNFVKYGRDGDAPDLDRAREFAYLNSGPYLARIRRADLRAWTGAFDRSKIEYYCGAANADGELDANWTHDIGKAAATGHSDIVTGIIIWNPGLRRYLTSYAYGDSWLAPPIPSTFFLGEAPHPWGPWTMIHSELIEPRAGDNLSWFWIMQPFMSPDGTRMWAAMSGRKPYGLQFLPVDLTTHEVVTRLAADATFSGAALTPAAKDSLSPAPIGFNKTGDSCAFAIPVKEAGLYALSYRYHCDAENQAITLVVNDHPQARLALGNTVASRYPWNEGSARFSLTAGTATIRFQLDSGEPAPSHFILDRIQVVQLSSPK
jgi:hypothetical protein